MNIKNNFLKMYRKQSCISQKNIAYLLNVDTGNISRYEKGKRVPTPEIILTYHILFGTSLKDLLHQQYITVVEKIITRSKKLIEQLKIEQPPKSNLTIAYLQNAVKVLSEQNHD